MKVSHWCAPEAVFSESIQICTGRTSPRSGQREHLRETDKRAIGKERSGGEGGFACKNLLLKPGTRLFNAPYSLYLPPSASAPLRTWSFLRPTPQHLTCLCFALSLPSATDFIAAVPPFLPFSYPYFLTFKSQEFPAETTISHLS